MTARGALLFLIGFAAFVGGPARGTEPSQAPPSARPRALPSDVAAFVTRRDRCDHFRGEAADTPTRAAEIARGLDATCRGTDAELARLKRRHRGDAAVRNRLDAYDPAVE